MISPTEVFKVSMRALRANKMRSFLTMLGIIIGVASVIASFAVGEGANRAIDKQLAAFGSNYLVVFPDRGAMAANVSLRPLTDQDAEAIARECYDAIGVAPQVNTSAQVIAGNLNWSTSIVGSTEDYGLVQDWAVESGRDLTAADVRRASKVCVIGQTIADKLFEGKSPLSEVIRIKKVPFRVVGVYKSKGQSQFGSDMDDFVLVPISAAQRRLVRSRIPGTVNRIFVKAASIDALDFLELQVTELLKERHRVRPGMEYGFQVRNITQMIEMQRQTTRVMMLLLACVATISLVVGGIGIMNIMLVSVTERTREIGIRMAIGAKSWDIRLQFLIEALMLSLIGGFLGIVGGVAAGKVVSSILQSEAIVTSFSVVLGFFFSALVGVGFGYYPAHKASLLNPIDALKYE